MNSLLHIHNADVYVTGSNSKFLSSDVITQFRGRGDEIHVYPNMCRHIRDLWMRHGTIILSMEECH